MPPSEIETWVINDKPSPIYRTVDVSFKSNNQSFVKFCGAADTSPEAIDGQYVMTGYIRYYTDESNYVQAIYYRKIGSTKTACLNASWTITWADNAYKTVVFDSSVTDTNLLTWLQANAVRQ